MAIGELGAKGEGVVGVDEVLQVKLIRDLAHAALPAKAIATYRLKAILKVTVHQRAVHKEALIKEVVPAQGKGAVAPGGAKVLVREQAVTPKVAREVKAVVVVYPPVGFGIKVIKEELLCRHLSQTLKRPRCRKRRALLL